MTRSTFTRFATALAIGASVLATSGVANARGGGGHGGGYHGTSSSFAAPSGAVVHDHRTGSTTPTYGGYHGGGGRRPDPTVRDHRGPNGMPQGGVTVTPSGHSRIPCYGNLC